MALRLDVHQAPRVIQRHSNRFWNDCEPTMFAHWDIVLFLESKDLCIELQGFFLVIDHDAGHNNSHFVFPFLGESHRSIMASNGAVFR